ASKWDLQPPGGERLVFRRPVRERSKHYLYLVLFFDRLEKSRSVRDKNRLSRGLDSEIDDFFRLRRRAKANRHRKREYWIIRSADHGTLPDLLKTLASCHPRLSGPTLLGSLGHFEGSRLLQNESTTDGAPPAHARLIYLPPPCRRDTVAPFERKPAHSATSADGE